MAEHSLTHVTSTPLECCHLERSSLALNLTGDSGYVSNSSGNNSSSFLNHSKISDSHSDESSKHLDSISETESTIFCEKVKFKSSRRDKRRVPESWQHYQVKSPRSYLTGSKYVDFMCHLGKKHQTLVVSQILSYLNDAELNHAANVSDTWRQMISSIPSEKERLRSFLKQQEHSKENRKINSLDRNRYPLEVHCFNPQTPRNTLTQIQNFQDSSSSSSASPSSSKLNYRFEAYQKEAQKLKSKRLFSCPKCKLPSHVDPKLQTSAQCTNSTCKYRFCILCQCEEHNHKLCDFISTPVVRKQSNIFGTAKNKRNLKRLLL